MSKNSRPGIDKGSKQFTQDQSSPAGMVATCKKVWAIPIVPVLKQSVSAAELAGVQGKQHATEFALSFPAREQEQYSSRLRGDRLPSALRHA